MKHRSGVLTSIFLSYSTIYSKRQNLYFTDGLISQSDDELILQSPRDIFNNKGEFISPPEKKIKNNFSSRDKTLGIAINKFINSALKGDDFSETDYLRSIEAVEIVLKINNKIMK